MADHCEADPCTADAIDRASAWQPMETAPHDCQILLYSRGDTYVGVWVQNPDTGDEAFAIAELGDHGRAIVHPTHWRPLPPAPDASGGKLTAR